MYKPLLLVCLAISSASLVFADDSDDVQLRLDPAVDAPVIAQVAKKDPVVQRGQPVNDAALAAQGWRSSTFDGDFTGYVEQSDVRGGTLAPGAMIHALPNKESPVLTVFEDGDRVSVMQNAPWSLIAVRKQLAVYFQGEPGVAPAVSAAHAAPVYDVAPMEGINAPEALADAPPEALAAEPPPAAVELPPPPPPAAEAPAQDVAIVPGVERPAEAPYSPPPGSAAPPRQEGTIPQFTEGVLARTRSNIFFKPPYQYQLLDRDGDRIAYVDVSDMLHFTSIEELIGKPIIVYGSLDKVADKESIVIRAAHLR